MKVQLFHKNNFQLAEGPFWDEDKGCLAFVDVLGPKFHFLQNEKLISHDMKSHVGSVVPSQKRNRYLCATQQGILFFDEADALFGKIIAHPEKGKPNIRYNDGKCDANGRYYVGSMAYDFAKKAGSLYRIDPDLTLSKIASNIGISNGLAFHYQSRKMYYIDSLENCVFSFEYDPKTGNITKRKIVIEFKKDGAPDGMSIDREGNLWVAMWGGSQILHIDPIGKTILQPIKIPATQVSSCCFGGKDYSTLFITTARTDLSKSQLKDDPLAGSIFCIKTDTQGFPTERFGK